MVIFLFWIGFMLFIFLYLYVWWSNILWKMYWLVCFIFMFYSLDLDLECEYYWYYHNDNNQELWLAIESRIHSSFALSTLLQPIGGTLLSFLRRNFNLPWKL